MCDRLSSSRVSPAEFQAWQQAFKRAFEAHLSDRLPRILNQAPPRLAEAIAYAVQDGGKRLRPMLVMLGGSAGDTHSPLPDLNSPSLQILWTAAIAVELIHGYSLIHDDLPSMDNDELRRGKPTVHRAFDEATAILAGDVLQSLAFNLLSTATAIPADTRLAWLQLLSTGANQMVYGQQLDTTPTAVAPTDTELSHRHHLKTGALLHAALMMGAVHQPAPIQAALTAFIRPLGLAFQIQDDILDATGTAAALGKTPGKDAADHKDSYVTVLGLTAARAHLNNTILEALAALEPLGASADALRACTEFVLNRDH
ncbi:MAG: polyprenyl synthetase family protein [Halothiobacillus sp.]